MGRKVALVTGGSSGIGLQTAAALRDRGCTVYEISRHGCEEQGVHHLKADVSDETQTAAAADEILKNEGRLDILVCCAGSGISGAAEFTDNAEAKQLLEVNLFGTVNCCKAAVPAMREQGGGTILCIGSVAGAIPIPFQAWYSVTKAAVGSYAGALRNELAPFGISVGCVMPGDIKTGFTAARRKSERGDDIYHGRIRRSVAVMEHDEESGMSAELVGRCIASAALRGHMKPTYTVGLKYKFFVMLSRLLPCRACSALVKTIYAK